ncbi:MAG TPA: M43 family zinc metalloprotease [Flavisolibacter sp.]
MFRRLFSYIACFLFALASVHGQKIKTPFPTSAESRLSPSVSTCATDVLLQEFRKSPAFKAAEEKMNQQILQYRQANDSTILALPVVFHIVDDNPFAFSDAQVAAAIQDLNDAFSKSGAYAASTGADTRIRFCLAKKDPDGGITNGITRTVSFFSNDLNPVIEDVKLKNLVQWDPSQYVNIWYIKSMHLEIMARFQCGVWMRMYAGGYATLPPGGGPTDGIVVTALGTMLAHEMGHYLGLYHTFEGLDCRNFNCDTDGDRVCDTPPDASVSSSPCGSPGNSCNTDTLSGLTADLPDMISNFMDYSSAACQNAFTQGQADRMRAAINTQRPGLLIDKCAPPCTDAIRASFTRDNWYPLPGAAINFTNTSTGATTYEWSINGTVAANTANFSTSFPAAGKYKITLKASNGTGCYSTFTHFAMVNCGVTSRFYTNKRQIAAKAPQYLDSIRFTNTSVNATSYQWLMANDKGMAEQVVSTAKDFSYVFTVPANYTVRLIATNGSCIDTTYLFPIPVSDPTPDGALFITGAECYQQTKVRVSYFICNYGIDGIPRNIPITFYNSDPRVAGAQKITTIFSPDSIRGLCCGVLHSTIIDVGYRGLNQLFAMFNDSGKVVPVVLPNTSFVEKFYTNNIASLSNFAFAVTATPALSVLEWGDTLQLSAQARPGLVSSYVWSSAKDLSCTSCKNPLLIANDSTEKQVVATSNLGCTDTARIVVHVPPYNDFSVEINDAQCKGEDSLRVNFTIRNSFKRAVIPKGLTVAFYRGDPSGAGATMLPKLFSVPDTVKAANATYTTVIKGMSNGKLYAVVNDSGKALPVALPVSLFLEKGYGNNFGAYDYVRFAVTPAPSLAVLEWRDTLQLNATAGPGVAASYLWSNAYNLSCAACKSPQLVADTTSVKQVIATSALGCKDTALMTIQVPPYNDFTVTVDDVQCAGTDSLYVKFTMINGFKRPLLPGHLSVSFYNSDPRTAGAVRLNPVFSIPDTLFAKQATFTTFIKGMPAGTLYTVINDSASPLPVVFPATKFLEKDYANNVIAFAYAPEELKVQPSDTTVFRKQLVPLQLNTTVYNPSSTLWSNNGDNTLTCSTCPNPVMTVYHNTVLRVQTENRFGCVLKGKADVKIFPPDFQVSIKETKCYTNNEVLLTFSVCMNNGYDSVWKGIPVSFYDGAPSGNNATFLLSVFVTPQVAGDTCFTYTTIIKEPFSNKITAVVNDKGGSLSAPVKQYDETNYLNNNDTVSYTPFNVSIFPTDTAISRWGNVELVPQADGGQAMAYIWKPAQYLSCAFCPSPVAAPPHTTQFELLAKNEFQCTDTAMAIVRTHSGEGVYISTAFTPNGDGKNDIFYIVSGPEVTQVKSFAVYNRWGQAVFNMQNFAANSPLYGWDGKLGGKEAPSQVYVYYVTVVLKGGKEKAYKGTVTLVR